MQLKLWTLYSGMQRLIMREEGQDLIEYALVVSLIAFAAVATMQTLATDINNAYTAIGTPSPTLLAKLRPEHTSVLAGRGSHIGYALPG